MTKPRVKKRRRHFNIFPNVFSTRASSIVSRSGSIWSEETERKRRKSVLMDSSLHSFKSMMQVSAGRPQTSQTAYLLSQGGLRRPKLTRQGGLRRLKLTRHDMLGFYVYDSFSRPLVEHNTHSGLSFTIFKVILQF